MRNTRSVILGVVVICAGLLFSCGGGGGNLDPVIAPVEEITIADLVAAGIPDLPADSSSSSIDNWDLARNSGFVHHSSIQGTGFVDDGAGNLVLDPDNLPARRVVGWALFEAQADEVDETIPVSLQMTGSGFSEFRVFYAVSNYSTGKWEIGGRILMDVISAGISLANQYTSPKGTLYILAVVGHPGTSNPPSMPLTIGLPEVNWTGPSIKGQGWTGELSRIGPDAIRVGILSDTTICQGIQVNYAAAQASDLVLTFPAEFNLTSFKGSDEELKAFWDSGIIDFLNFSESPGGLPAATGDPLIRFYNSNELHGALKPFEVLFWTSEDFDGDGYALNSLEIELTASYVVMIGMLRDGTSNTLVAAPNVTISILNQNEELLTQTTTDDQGAFSFTINKPGNFILEYSADYYPERLYGTASIVRAQTDGVSGLARIDFFENQAGWGL